MLNKVRGSFGPLGRAANSGITVAVFGGHGFIGRYLLNQLGSCGSRVNLPFRGDEFEFRHVKPSFDLGQLVTFPFHPRDNDSIRAALANVDVVVNLIGKYYETKHAVPTRRSDGSLSRVNFDFDEVHSAIPVRIAEIAKEMNVPHFIHVSALSANAASQSKWSRSKMHGEEAVRKVLPNSIIVRPSTVFGTEDRFLNWIAEAMIRLPFFPIINKGSNLVQPVYSVDVAKGIFEILKRADELAGSTFEFAGPIEYTHKEIVEFVQDITMRKKFCLEISPASAKLGGRFIENLIAPMFTEDMVHQILEDNILIPKDSVLTFEDLGINPSRMDRHAFDYLHRFRRGGHFTLAKGYH